MPSASVNGRSRRPGGHVLSATLHSRGNPVIVSIQMPSLGSASTGVLTLTSVVFPFTGY